MIRMPKNWQEELFKKIFDFFDSVNWSIMYACELKFIIKMNQINQRKV